MPELPEVETTVKGIKPWLENKIIKKINVYNASLRWPIPKNLKKKHLSKKIISITRRAKYILIHLESDYTLILHLGMSGSLVVINDAMPLAKHDHFELVMDDGTQLRFNDPRRFGCVLDSNDYQNHKLIKKLGPEPLGLEFNGEYLKKKSKNKTQAIKNFIMDGHIVVGVGNIYASESLFRAGIHPNKPAGKVSLAKYQKLAEVIKQVLSLAIQAGGTTLKDFINAEGKPGYFSQKLNVYGRKDKPCVNCESKILQKTIGQRSTFYCGSCQK
ncbi:MAG: bifunctional DNA-formamidopyrimidine glycosylase/DNA-(apurinic or apyrimidinic site) lyase [Marinicellaceae bacterium]